MTVYKALLIDITPLYYGSFLCTFCIERDKFQLPVPANMATELNNGEYYDVDFDIYCNQFGNKFSFNFINPAKDSSHE